jgi:hypothetical protein
MNYAPLLLEHRYTIGFQILNFTGQKVGIQVRKPEVFSNVELNVKKYQRKEKK